MNGSSNILWYLASLNMLKRPQSGRIRASVKKMRAAKRPSLVSGLNQTALYVADNREERVLSEAAQRLGG